MAAKSQPLQINSISSQIYLSLKKAILSGELSPGSRLLVLEIAGRFQVSQAPVREALERLKQEGLITSKPNKGSVVSDITAKEIKDIFVMREIIEGFAVKETMPTLTDSDYQHLETIIMEMGKAIQENDLIKILELDMDFHGFFYQRCGNHVVQEVWNQMKAKVMRFMAISNKFHTTEGLVKEHMDLVDVLRTGDPVAVEKRFIHHMKAYKVIHLT